MENIRQNYSSIKDLLQRLVHSNMLNAGSLLLLANAIVVALGLIRTPLMTWVLPKDEVGMLGVVAAWLPFVQLLSLTGLDSASYHYASKGQTDAFRVNLRYRLRWSLLSAGVLIFGAIFWWRSGETKLAWLFIIAGLSYPFTAGLTAGAGLLSAQEKFKSLFWYRIFESLTDFTGFIPLLFSIWFISKVVTFYTANQLATTIMLVGVSLGLIRGLKKSETPKLNIDEEKELVNYGKHLTAINGISVLQGRSDAILVSFFFPLTTIADYSIALIIQEQIRRLWNIYLTLRYPALVKLNSSSRGHSFLIEGFLVWMVFLVIGIVIILMGYWLIPIILPASYVGSLGYMAILIGASIIGIPGGMSETYFRTYQVARPQYIMRSIGAVAGMIAPLILIIPFGAYGAAGGKFLANLVLSFAGVVLSIRHANSITS